MYYRPGKPSHRFGNSLSGMKQSEIQINEILFLEKLLTQFM